MDRSGVARKACFLLIAILLVPLVVSVTATSGTTASPALPQDHAVEVTECRTIDTPGRYVLTADIENSTATECITIVASDVVFDGRGHTLDAGDVDHPTEAIAAGYTDPPIENVTIRNLTVTDWTQGIGCRAVASNVTIDNVTARQNGLASTDGGGYGQELEAYGIYVGDLTHNVTVTDSIAVENAVGIYIANTSRNVVRDNLVRDNPGGGIVLGGDTWQNSVVDNRIVDNGLAGIKVGSRAGVGPGNRTTISHNVLRDNRRGIFLQNTDTTISVVGNRIVNSTNESLWVAVVDGDVTVADNAIRRAQGAGIVIDSSKEILVRNNTIRGAAGAGILLEGTSTRNILATNLVVGANPGLAITDRTSRTAVQGLTVTTSANRSIVLTGAGNNTVVNTTVRGSGGVLVGSADNRLRNLTLDSGRVSVTGRQYRLSSVAEIPAPPSGRYRVGVGVRLRQGTDEPARAEAVVLTVFYPPEASDVTLWRWSGRGDWAQLRNTTDHQSRAASTVTLPRNRDFLVVPLAGAPFATPTPTVTEGPSPPQNSSPTGNQTPTVTTRSTTPSEVSTPGFGVVAAVLALVSILSVLGGWIRHGNRTP